MKFLKQNQKVEMTKIYKVPKVVIMQQLILHKKESRRICRNHYTIVITILYNHNIDIRLTTKRNRKNEDILSVN